MPSHQAWEMFEDEYVREQVAAHGREIQRNIDAWKAEADRSTRISQKVRAQASADGWSGVQFDWNTKPERQAQWAERMRERYRKEVKKAISTGENVHPSVVEQHAEFKRGVDARARYEKGWKTSYANVSQAVDYSTQEKRGFKVKRQDGKPMTPEQRAEIERGVSEVECVMGPLDEQLRSSNLTIAHTSGKHPFLSDFAGLFQVGEKTISTGVKLPRVRDGQVVYEPFPSLAHELAHWLDFEGGKVKGVSTSRYTKAGKKQGETPSLIAAEAGHDWRGLLYEATRSMTRTERIREVMSTKFKTDTPEKKAEKEFVKVSLGAYWRRPEEVFARLTEQYIATKIGDGPGVSMASPEQYQRRIGWWSKEEFERLMPMVEEELVKRLELIKAKEPQAPRRPTPIACPVLQMARELGVESSRVVARVAAPKAAVSMPEEPAPVSREYRIAQGAQLPPKSFRREVGWLKPENMKVDGAPTRLILYPDGEAYAESLDRAVKIARSDPAHPLNPGFRPDIYIEGKEAHVEAPRPPVSVPAPVEPPKTLKQAMETYTRAGGWSGPA